MPLINAVKNESGVALVAAIGVVAILLVLALQAGRLAGGAAEGTAAENSRFAAEEMAMSGIHLALVFLARDRADNEIDSVQECWADPEKRAAAVAELGFETGDLSLSIEDEMGKIQLNALLSQFPGNIVNPDQQVLLERFFHLAGEDESAEEEVNPQDRVNALKDWLDSRDDDAITGFSGAESAYYQSLTPAYDCPNRHLIHIDELAMVKGFDTLSIPPETVFTVFGLEASEEAEEKRYAFTGKVNINTAPVPVLAALLPDGKDQYAQDLADFREERQSDGGYAYTLESGWYEQVVSLSEKEKTAFEKRITYASRIFRADSRASRNGIHVSLSAVIMREKNKESGKWQCRLMRMERV